MKRHTDPAETSPRWTIVLRRVFELVVLLGTGAFLVLSLVGEHPVSTPIREYLIENAARETGALNLVTAIYLGFRAFDTLGETIVLLLAVSAVLTFVGREP